MPRPINEQIGRLHLGSAGRTQHGKLIDTWTFVSPLRGEAAQIPVSVELFMRKVYDAGIRVEFVARSAALPDKLLINTDIEALRVAVEDAVREQFILQSGVAWEDWIEVKVTGGDRRSGNHTCVEQLVIEYRGLKRGTTPELSGQDYTINFNGVAVQFPSPKRAGEADPDIMRAQAAAPGDAYAGVGGREADAEYSYISDSPSNRAALDQLIQSLRTLRLRIADFVSQQNLPHAIGAVVAARSLALSHTLNDEEPPHD